MNQEEAHHPPKWANRFLKFYCNPKLLEQIQGDLYELYFWRLEEQGAKKAKRAFWWDVIRFFRWKVIKRTTTQKQQFNNITMLKNYFKIGWRNLLNQKTPSFINIFGLAIAIACCMIAYLFIEGVRMKGMLHENKDEIYMVTHTAQNEEGVYQYGYVSTPLIPTIKTEYHNIDRVVRVNHAQVIAKYKNSSFDKFVQFVDTDYMDMFTYELVLGEKGVLNDPYQIIITESTANLFFRDDFPLGKELELIINDEKKTFTIGAVIKDHSAVAMFHFEILVNNHHLLSSSGLSLDESWESNAWTFVQIEDSDKLTSASNQLNGLIAIQNSQQPDKKYLDIQLERFMDLAGNPKQIIGGAGSGAGLAPQIVLVCIGTFLLILAIFNYINIAILMATKRIKEIGIRKVIGSNKHQLVFQFLSENLITCTIAIVTGLMVSYFLFIPWFNAMASTDLEINLLNNINIYFFLIGLLLFITLASGAYPAFYISSFKPLQIFSGKQKIGSKSKFTSVLLTFQFMLAVITVIAGITFLRTSAINEDRDWGYDQSNKIVFNSPSLDVFNEIRDELQQQSAVKSIAGSIDRIGLHRNMQEVTFNQDVIEVNVIKGGLTYPETFDLVLTQGRFFDKNLTTDIDNSILINESFIDSYGLEQPINSTILIDSSDYFVVGVVKDFHYTNFRHDIEPTIIQAVPDSSYRYMTVKVEPNEIHAMSELIKQSWHEKVENNVYTGVIQAEVFDFYFQEMRGLRNTFIFTASFAIILSAMGLFGLVSLNISAKMKDYSIKKVLGASMAHLSRIVMKKYLILWLIGCILGGYLGTLAITALLNDIYTFHSGVGIIPIISAILLLLGVITFTISTQLLKVRNLNPVETLKTE